MSDDIVARLRNCDCIPHCLCGEAADEIERLRRDYSAAEQDHVDAVVAYSEAEQEIERLRAELRTYTGDGHNTKGEQSMLEVA
ncbi:MAG: hypothetical protein RL461_1651 [Planctomycetota bacterium]|jgi:hypothetical protein